MAPPLTDFVKGVRLLEEDGNAGCAALPLLSQRSLASTPLADYARFYTGKALLELRRYPEAEAAFAAVASRSIEGHLPEDAAVGRAQALEASVDFAGAVTSTRSCCSESSPLRMPCSRGLPPQPKPRGTSPR